MAKGRAAIGVVFINGHAAGDCALATSGDWDMTLVASSQTFEDGTYALDMNNGFNALPGIVSYAIEADSELVPSHDALAGTMAATWAQAPDARRLPALQLEGNAVDELQEAVTSGQTFGVWTIWDPWFRPLHGHPRYVRLVAPK